MQKPLQERVDHLVNDSNTIFALLYSFFMSFIVVIVCVTFVIETYPISPELFANLEILDTSITAVFLVDYLVRWWAKRFSIRYLFTPMALIDLLAILPLFMATAHWQFIRVLRLFRILRLFRAFQGNPFLFKKMNETQLRLTRILFSLFCIVFISSGIIYDVEHRHNPLEIGTFFDALYFAVVSLSTVGYGDIVPVTDAGRLVVILMIFSGGLVIPWQAASLAHYLVEKIHKEEIKCRRCKLDLHEPDANYCRICGKALVKK